MHFFFVVHFFFVHVGIDKLSGVETDVGKLSFLLKRGNLVVYPTKLSLLNKKEAFL